MTERNVFDEFLDRYGDSAGEEGPVLFAREVFGADLDQWQIDTLRAYGRRERQITVRACHGPGKTYIAALMVWHMLICRFPQNTVATAPSKAQLEDALVKEILKRHEDLPAAIADLYEIKKNRIELKSSPQRSWFAARTSREEKPEALQGVHEDNVLIIADEASGVPEKIFQAAFGSKSGGDQGISTTLLLGNPVRTSGYFYDSHMKPGVRERWFKVHVGASDSSRVTEEYCDEVAAQYGRDSDVYRVRVLGEFPKVDRDTVIPLGLITSARERDIIVPKIMGEVWGLDVARYGGDENALLRRNALAVLPKIEKWGGVDLMQTAGRTKNAWDETPEHMRPNVICVDAIGLGAGVADRLRELGLPARAVNVSEAPSSKDKYLNLRAELWFLAREWLDTFEHILPSCPGGCVKDCPHEILAGELTIPKYKFTSSGKLQVESKEDMKRRGHESPNLAEAFILTFAAPASSLIHGSNSTGWSHGWNAPLSRGLSMV